MDFKTLEYPRMLYRGIGIADWCRVENADQATQAISEGWSLSPQMAESVSEVEPETTEAEVIKRGPGRPRKFPL